MRRTWILLPISLLALACRDAAPTEPQALIGLPLPVPLPGPVRIDLGTFGGASSYANDINSDGTVVGSADNAAELRRAFRWTPLGGMTDLGTLPGDDWSMAISITDDGQILGQSGSSSVSTSRGTYVLWSSDGTITALAIPLLPGALLGVASDFNARGEVIGSDVFATQHAWIWSEAQGKYDITANVPGGSREGGASQIDAGGLVVGTSSAGTCSQYPFPNPSCWHAFLFSYEAGYRDIGTPGDDPNATVMGMGLNDGPTVVGSASIPGLGGRPYRWTEAEGFTILEAVSGYATSVNGGGLAVGTVWDAVLSAAQATAWPRSGGAIRLSPDDPNPSIATGVNNAGVVVGWTAQSGGGNHATLWLLGPASELLTALAARDALKPALSVGTATVAAKAAGAAANACLSDTHALLSRGALFDCVNRSAAPLARVRTGF